jgi:hypothetical protein
MDTLGDIMTTCVILHNMIIEDESGLNLSFFFDNVGTRVKPSRNTDIVQAFLETYRQIQLQEDPVHHHWQMHGN